MVGTVEGILGLKPESRGIVIDPAIPSEWKEFTMDKKFRGKMLHITVKNPNGVEHGVKSVVVNNTAINGTFIEEIILKDENEIIIQM